MNGIVANLEVELTILEWLSINLEQLEHEERQRSIELILCSPGPFCLSTERLEFYRGMLLIINILTSATTIIDKLRI